MEHSDSSAAGPNKAVRDNAAAHRFELETDGRLAIAVYRLDGGTMTLTHTEVPRELEGRGIGGRLVRGALDAARERGLAVLPLCSFVAHYMRAHPDTHDLLQPAYRARAGL